MKLATKFLKLILNKSLQLKDGTYKYRYHF